MLEFFGGPRHTFTTAAAQKCPPSWRRCTAGSAGTPRGWTPRRRRSTGRRPLAATANQPRRLWRSGAARRRSRAAPCARSSPQPRRRSTRWKRAGAKRTRRGGSTCESKATLNVAQLFPPRKTWLQTRRTYCFHRRAQWLRCKSCKASPIPPQSPLSTLASPLQKLNRANAATNAAASPVWRAFFCRPFEPAERGDSGGRLLAWRADLNNVSKAAMVGTRAAGNLGVADRLGPVTAFRATTQRPRNCFCTNQNHHPL